MDSDYRVTSTSHEPVNPMSREDEKKRYDNLIINLRTLPLCNYWERLMIVDETYIVVDRRVGQSVRRWWWGDNRQAVVSFLQRMLDDVTYFVKPCGPQERSLTQEMKERVVQLLPCFRTALTRVKCIYADDSITSFSLENIIDDVETMMKDLKACSDNPQPPTGARALSLGIEARTSRLTGERSTC